MRKSIPKYLPVEVLFLLVPLQEFDPTRLDNQSGKAWLGLGFLVFLGWIAWRVRRVGRSIFSFSLESGAECGKNVDQPKNFP